VLALVGASGCPSRSSEPLGSPSGRGRSSLAPAATDGLTSPSARSEPAGPGPRGAPPPCATGGRLLFTSERDGNREIYSVCPDGTDTQRRTTDPADDHVAAVGPRGSIAVLSSTGHPGAPDYLESIRLLEPSGNLRTVGTANARQRNPSWLPDGSGMLVESGRDGFSDIHRLDLRGSMRPVVRHPAGNYEPAVAPDGRTFAFVSSRDGDAELYRASIDGTQPLRLTYSRGDDTAPSYAPDGSRIAFLSTRLGAARVFVMNADGSKPRSLDAESAVGATQLAWSPDGSAIAYVLVRETRAELRIVRVDDGALLAEHRGPFRVETPCFSPDGRWIAFASSEVGDVELYIMRSEGGEARRVTRSPGVDFLPRWLPAEGG